MLKLYDTLTKKLRPFNPLHGNRVYMFVCGITPYDSPHLGHARAYVFYDTLAKYLMYKGYAVFYLQNVTDIDDKIINKAKNENKKVGDISSTYFSEYLNMMDKLHVDSVTWYAKATDYIEEIKEQIKILVKKGYAYSSNGSVYFRASKFEDFGKLSGQIRENLEEGARVDIDPNKENPEDFVLWKGYKEGEPFWESPWGPGRPGWHIEDTAIALHHFHEHYDIHGGGMDLVFPHHEAEIAQAEATTGVKPYVNYWVHVGLVNVEGKKMSKSLNNFITIKDLLNKYNAETIRFFILNNEHSKPLEFSYNALNEANSALEKLVRFYNKLDDINFNENYDQELEHIINLSIERFFENLDNDLSFREAFSILFSMMGDVYKKIGDRKGNVEQYKRIKAFLVDVGIITSIFPDKKESTDTLNLLIEKLIEYRKVLRNNKKYDESDYIRALLNDTGIEIEDSSGQIKWHIKR